MLELGPERELGVVESRNVGGIVLRVGSHL